MAYPKNDTDFTAGTVTFIEEVGDEERLKVGYHMPNWLSSPGYKGWNYVPKPPFEVKEGMVIRIYAFQGLPERGVYIGGRIVVPYKTKEEAARSRKSLTASVNRVHEQDLTCAGIGGNY